MIRLKNYSCHVLTFMQVHAVLTDKKFTSKNDYTHNY